MLVALHLKEERSDCLLGEEMRGLAFNSRDQDVQEVVMTVANSERQMIEVVGEVVP